MKALLLLSGGFDSPVAGYLMQKKGVEIIALNFSYDLITDTKPTEKSREIAKLLGFKKFITMDISEDLIRFSKECRHGLYFVLMKRLMIRKAEEVAKKEYCDFIITGDNLAQVSSQTLQNLVVITKAIEMPIARPLLGFDKGEIIKISEEIGTFEISKGKEHCDILGPKYPETKASLEEVEKEETKASSHISQRLPSCAPQTA